MAGRRRRADDARHDGLRYPAAEAPFYLATGDEIAVFEACHARGLPVMLKGPTGCGKTRFVEHMAWRLDRPLVTVACHDDLSASDLTGRYLIRGSDTVWLDGPLTRAARRGAICYLDEIVEARAGHRRRHPPADRRPPHPAPRQDRRAARRRARAFSSVSPTTPATSTA